MKTEKRDLKMLALKTGVTELQAKECWQQQKLEERTDSLEPRASSWNMALLNLSLGPVKLISNF